MKRFGYKYGFIDVRYQAGIKNSLDRSNQFNFGESGALRDYTFNYGMVDDDFRQNAIYLNVGIILPMYKPRKVNTVTIQSVLKSWFTKKEKGGDDE